MNLKYALNIDRSCIIREDEVVQFPVTYHVVVTPSKQERLFIDKRNCNNLAYLLFEAAVLHDYGLFAFCIMPDHAHILCRPGNIAIGHFINLIKLRFEFAYAKVSERCSSSLDRSISIWQSAYKQDVINNAQIISTALYILENPVRNGIATSPMDYPFSFAYGGKPYRP